MSTKDIILNVKIEGANEQLKTLNLLQEEINALALQKKALNVEQKALNDSIKAGTITEEQAAIQTSELAAEQVKLNLITKETKTEYQQAEKALLNQGKAIDSAEGSIAAMRLELSASQKAYVNLSQAERENYAIGGVLQKQIKAQSDELKHLEKEIGITSRSVGDYGKAFESALPLMGGFGQQMQQVISTLGQIKTALTAARASMGATATATGGLSGALKVLKVALISSGIGAIVVILGSMAAAVLATEKGMDKLNSILQPIKETFKALFEVVQNVGLGLFDKLKKAIDNPVQSLKDLGNAIVGNIVNRFKGAVLFVQSYGATLINSFKLMGLGIKKVLADVPILGSGIDKKKLQKDLDDAKAAALKSVKELASASLQVATGLDKKQQQAAANRLKAIAAEGEAGRKRGIQIAALQKSIAETETTLNEERERANLLIQEQREIIKDADATEKQKLKATKEAIALLDERTKKDVAYLKQKLELSKLVNFNDADERKSKKELSEINAEINTLESSAIKEKLKLNKDANAIVKANRAADAKAIEEQAKKVKEAEEAAKQEALNTEKEKTDAKIKALNETEKLLSLERQFEAASTDETAEMKFQKELELQKNIQELRMKSVTLSAKAEMDEANRVAQEKHDLKKISDEELIALGKENQRIYDEQLAQVKLEGQIAEAEILGEEKDRQAELEKEKQDEIDEKEAEQKKQLKEAAFTVATDLSNAYFDNQDRKIADTTKREIEALTLRKEAGLITQEEFEKQRLEIDKKAFDKKKRIATAESLINGIIAVSKAFAQFGYPAGLIPAGLATVQTALQVAAIQSQKFAKGGMLVGASHANGGINLGNNQEGEGGEIIINKVSSKKHTALLSAINQDGGGVPIPSTSGLRKFQNGGVLSSANDLSNITADITQGVINAIGSIKVVNVASETADVANRVNQIKNISTF